ncbi:minor capsid protein [Alteribacillus sp. JSM 102045]|uniref:minor capsid protein n=1 Tax=Alteribacillus sp. JSM 102045 TaxID=1562101 RepID=UPI0035BF8027
MKFDVSVEMDNLIDKFDQLNKEGQKALDSEILQDSNEYAPMDEDNLRESAVRNTEPGQGKVIWDTPYAKRLYYNPQYNFSKDKNPKAQGLWFEAAKAERMGNWEKIMQLTAKNIF